MIPILFKLIMGDIENSQQRKKDFLILCGICIVLVIGLRDKSVGTSDTSTYCKLYEGVANYSNLKTFLTGHKIFENGFFLSECLFYIFTYFCAKILPNAQWFILITSAFITFSALRFIYRNSSNILLSTIMYICLGLMTFNMNGMRQALAMSICLFAYDFVKKRKLLPFILIVVIAMLMHKTAVFFSIVYFIARLKCNFKSITFFTVSVLLFLIFADRLVEIFDNVADKNYSDVGGFDSGGYVTLLIYGLVLIFAVLFGWKDRKNSDFALVFYLTILGCALYCGRYISTQIYERMSYYFFYAVLLLLPQTVMQLKESEKPMVVMIITSLSILLFAYRLYGSAFHNFVFFWR